MPPLEDTVAAPASCPPAGAFADLDLDLDALRAMFEEAASVLDEAASDAELVERMAALVALRNSVDAALSTTECSFARVHAARHAATEQPEHLERSIGTQIGLANRMSPTAGRDRMRVARDLHDGLDGIRLLHGTGRIDAGRVRVVVRACTHLDHAERAEVDRRLAEEDVSGLGLGRLRDLVTRLAAEVAPGKFRERARSARAGRRVTIRQAADGMADLSAHLPVEQGVACYGALCKAYQQAQVDPEPLTRGCGQVMADTLVERLTGQATAEHVDIEVQVVVPLGALLDENSPLPAEVAGFGPVPVEILSRARGRAMLRRLITSTGVVIGGDSQSRCFPPGPADLIRARDRHRCAAPYCDALARQTDHVVRAADGGVTSFDDGQASCELHNYLREQVGWWVEPAGSGTRITTPTGHVYASSPIPRQRTGREQRAGSP